MSALSHRLSCAALLVALVGSGCVPALYLDDDIGLEFVHERTNLETPYVVGAEFGMRLSLRSSLRSEGWTVSSLNPEVFTIVSSTFDPDSGLELEVRAAAAGATALVVTSPEGQEVLRADIAVEAASRLELEAAAAARSQVTGAGLVEDAVSLLVGEDASFEARYFAEEGEEVFGYDALAVVVPAEGLTASVDTVGLFRTRRDRVRLEATAVGSYQLPLEVGGVLLTNLEVEVVGPEQAAAINISWGSNEDSDTRHVMALLQDADGRPLYGPTLDWSWGEDASEAGDVLVYEYEAGVSTPVMVSWGSLEASVSVEGTPLGARDSDAGTMGCSSAGRDSGGVLLSLGLLLLGARRRREAHGA